MKEQIITTWISFIGFAILSFSTEVIELMIFFGIVCIINAIIYLHLIYKTK